MEYEHIIHPFEPVYDEKSEILILGSLPSVKSREQKFYYGHPRNRFWQVLAGVFGEEVPFTIEEKKEFLLRHHIAVWDVIESCDIKGSSDSSIRNVVATDLESLLAGTQIKRIFVNGKTAGKLFHLYQSKQIGMEAVVLPSTSPANAAFSLDKLIEIWENSLNGNRDSRREK